MAQDYGAIFDDLNQSFNKDTPYGAWTPDNISTFDNTANQSLQQFKSQFSDMVGRAPNGDEIQTFVNNYLIPNEANIRNSASPQVTNASSYINQFIGQNYNQAAQATATQKLQDQQAQANSLGDLFEQQGNSAINSTEQSLLDYQSKLFDRLRPNLITSLKSQGLLDTGGMNEAMAGVQGDLANQASNYIAQLNLANKQGANQIRFAGAAAPYQYQAGAITNNPAMMFQVGQGALGQNNSVFNSNLDYAHQLGLINAQASAQSSLQPSFLRTFGQGFAGSLGGSAGMGAGQFMNSSLFGQKQGTPGGSVGNAYAGYLA